MRSALLALVEPDERGDPMSPLRWTTKSARKLVVELTRQGHRVSADTVAGLLREEGFSLQANAKTIEGAQHPDRDARFRYLNEQARDHRNAGGPVISVDSKKKELIGDYRNAEHEWQHTGQPMRVKTHDFLGQAAKAIPYGIYDMTANIGWVSIGTDHDTAAFAVASVRRWWQAVGPVLQHHRLGHQPRSERRPPAPGNRGVHIPASAARFRTPTDIARFLNLDKNEIKPKC